MTLCISKLQISRSIAARRFGHRLGAAFIGIAILSIVATGGWAADQGELHLRCVNAVSGANWPVVVDLDRGLVDARPATITASHIEWRDPGGGVYQFDRMTGRLQLSAASSTGGYFLHYTCRPE